MTNKEAFNAIMLLQIFFKEEAKFNEALKMACKLLETAEWVGISPQVDSEQCSKCGYNIQSKELRTPYCPWCGREMINFGVTKDE